MEMQIFRNYICVNLTKGIPSHPADSLSKVENKNADN